MLKWIDQGMQVERNFFDLTCIQVDQQQEEVNYFYPQK